MQQHNNVNSGGGNIVARGFLLLLKITAAGLSATFFWQVVLFLYLQDTQPYAAIADLKANVNVVLAPSENRSKASLSANISQLFQSHNPLGSAASAATPITTVVTAEEIDIEVLGLIVTPKPEQAWAMLSVAGAAQKIYRTGDKLTKQMQLVEISPKFLLASKGSQLLRISLYSSEDALSKSGSKSAVKSGAETAAEQKYSRVSPAQPAPRTLHVEQSLRKTLLRYPERINKFVRIRPLKKEGQLYGYQLYKGQNKKAFEASGIKDGDIVTHIEGQAVKTLSLGKLLASGLISNNRVPVTIERQGVSRKVELMIQ